MKSLMSVVAVSLAAVSVATADVLLESGVKRVDLIELFTSEGCSSCPPAEAWLNKLREDDRLWREFVPVAFHVSYWDRLGWRDRFASKTYTARQYAYADAWRSRSVYTPCFVRNGREWRDRTIEGGKRTEAGTLRAEIGEAQGMAIRVQFAPTDGIAPAEFQAHVALLGSDIESKVRSGENGGKTLAHDFVVLHLQSAAMVPDDSGSLRAAMSRPEHASSASKPNAVAVWITRRGDLEPVQAAGGWLELD